MPSQQHEVLVELFRERPLLVADLLAGPLGVAVPEFQRASLSSGELTDVVPTEYRADAVVTLTVGDAPVFAVVVEVQLRADARKRRSWPAYVATLHSRLGCQVMLLVVSPDPVVAAWCATPIDIGGPGLVLNPLVLGPAKVPVVTSVAVARRSPELAVLSAMAHGAGTAQLMVFESLLAALNVVDHDHANLYADAVLTVLPAAAREYLEVLLTTTSHRYQSDFARRYFDQGEARGEARAVLRFLEARGIDVPDEIREKITACTDLEQLDLWIGRAADVSKVDELFE